MHKIFNSLRVKRNLECFYNIFNSGRKRKVARSSWNGCGTDRHKWNPTIISHSLEFIRFGCQKLSVITSSSSPHPRYKGASNPTLLINHYSTHIASSRNWINVIIFALTVVEVSSFHPVEVPVLVHHGSPTSGLDHRITLSNIKCLSNQVTFLNSHLNYCSNLV